MGHRTHTEPPATPDGTTTWHLYWQAAIGRDFFADPTLPEAIRERLIQAHATQGRVLIDYLVLPGEIHTVSVLRAGDTPCALARAIGAAVARRVHTLQPLRNPVFAARFSACPLPSADAVRDAVRLLSWRPVCTGLRRSRVHHVYGGLRCALGLVPVKAYNPTPLLRLFGEGVRSSRAALRAWVAQRPDATHTARWELALGLAPGAAAAGGVPAMAQRMHPPTAAALLAEAGPGGEPAALRLLEAWVATRLMGASSAAPPIAARSRPARARALVACLAVDLGLCTAARVARHAGRAKSTLCEQMQACRRRPSDRALLAVDPATLLAEARAIRDRSNLQDLTPNF